MHASHLPHSREVEPERLPPLPHGCPAESLCWDSRRWEPCHCFDGLARPATVRAQSALKMPANRRRTRRFSRLSINLGPSTKINLGPSTNQLPPLLVRGTALKMIFLVVCYSICSSQLLIINKVESCATRRLGSLTF